MSTPLKILLVEPSLILRSGMSSVLRRLTGFDMQVVESAGAEPLDELLAAETPDILLIAPAVADEETLTRLRRHPLRVVALQNALLDARLMQCFDAAVSIYDTAEQIREKLQSLGRAHENESPQELLSAREKEIIVGVAKGLTNKQIAEELFISTHTVITHRRNIAAKLQIHSPAGLTIYAIVNKLVELNDVKRTIHPMEEQ